MKMCANIKTLISSYMPFILIPPITDPFCVNSPLTVSWCACPDVSQSEHSIATENDQWECRTLLPQIFFLSIILFWQPFDLQFLGQFIPDYRQVFTTEKLRFWGNWKLSCFTDGNTNKIYLWLTPLPVRCLYFPSHSFIISFISAIPPWGFCRTKLAWLVLHFLYWMIKT